MALIDTFHGIERLIRNPYYIFHLRHSLLLNSMQKSGTNYLRLMLTNYLYNIGKSNPKMISYDEMHNTIFPNVRDDVFRGYATKKQAGFHFPGGVRFDGNFWDFTYDHGSILDNFPFRMFSRARRTILLYRNPLDLLVSRYYYFYHNRPDSTWEGNAEVVESPADLIPHFLPEFSNRYKSMLREANRNARSILISYENLIDRPRAILSTLITFCGIDPDMNLVDFAVESSSRKKVKEEERRTGSPIHTPYNSSAKSFIRSGKVGEWRDYLTDDDYLFARKVLEDEGISLKDFDLG